MLVEFHPEATEEVESSADWYAEQSLSAARDFLVAVDLTIKSIASDPKRFALVDDRHRGCSISHFPFQIVFRIHADLLTIVAVAHAKRRPGYWRHRSASGPSETT